MITAKEENEEFIQVVSRAPIPKIIPIDEWTGSQDAVFSNTRGAIMANISPLYGKEPGGKLDYFIMSPKRCYNSETKMKDEKVITGFRDHNNHYLNYFEKFFDRDHELFGVYSKIKYFIDYETDRYTEENLMYDLRRHIIDHQAAEKIHYCIKMMNDANYKIHLSYRNNKNPCLEYTDRHAYIFMEISIIQNMIIPLLSHFIHMKKIVSSEQIKNILLKAFDYIFIMVNRKYNVDMYSKLLETTFSNVQRSRDRDQILYDMQDIRGRNYSVHSMYSVEDIILQIIPKYVYNCNVVCFNYNAIMGDIKYKITGVPYEFSLVAVSSSNRDEDNNSESDKFEAHLAKNDEALLLQTLANYETTMDNVIRQYGPFHEDEIDFYMRELASENSSHRPIINDFQRTLVNYMFMRTFEDPQAIKLANYKGNIILMIAAKRRLESEGLFTLSQIIGGKISRLAARKTVNKKIMQRMALSNNFPLLVDKYRNEKLYNHVIFKNVAQILASEFKYIDFYNSSINGRMIDKQADLICEELLLYALLI